MSTKIPIHSIRTSHEFGGSLIAKKTLGIKTLEQSPSFVGGTYLPDVGKLILNFEDGSSVEVEGFLTESDIKKGEKGVPGPKGSQGKDALYAKKGKKGPPGCMGPTGPQGEIGPTGPQGPMGATGPQGPMGIIGPTGPDGLTGEKGEQTNCLARVSYTDPGAIGVGGLWVLPDSCFDYPDIDTIECIRKPRLSSEDAPAIDGLYSRDLKEELDPVPIQNDFIKIEPAEDDLPEDDLKNIRKIKDPNANLPDMEEILKEKRQELQDQIREQSRQRQEQLAKTEKNNPPVQSSIPEPFVEEKDTEKFFCSFSRDEAGTLNSSLIDNPANPSRIFVENKSNISILGLRNAIENSGFSVEKVELRHGSMITDPTLLKDDCFNARIVIDDDATSYTKDWLINALVDMLCLPSRESTYTTVRRWERETVKVSIAHDDYRCEKERQFTKDFIVHWLSLLTNKNFEYIEDSKEADIRIYACNLSSFKKYLVSELKIRPVDGLAGLVPALCSHSNPIQPYEHSLDFIRDNRTSNCRTDVFYCVDEFLPSTTGRQYKTSFTNRLHTLIHEFYHAIGSWHLSGTYTNTSIMDENYAPECTIHVSALDFIFSRVLYDGRIRSGMTRAQVVNTLKNTDILDSYIKTRLPLADTLSIPSYNFNTCSGKGVLQNTHFLKEKRNLENSALWFYLSSNKNNNCGLCCTSEQEHFLDDENDFVFPICTNTSVTEFLQTIKDNNTFGIDKELLAILHRDTTTDVHSLILLGGFRQQELQNSSILERKISFSISDLNNITTLEEKSQNVRIKYVNGYLRCIFSLEKNKMEYLVLSSIENFSIHTEAYLYKPQKDSKKYEKIKIKRENIECDCELNTDFYHTLSIKKGLQEIPVDPISNIEHPSDYLKSRLINEETALFIYRWAYDDSHWILLKIDNFDRWKIAFSIFDLATDVTKDAFCSSSFKTLYPIKGSTCFVSNFEGIGGQQYYAGIKFSKKSLSAKISFENLISLNKLNVYDQKGLVLSEGLSIGDFFEIENKWLL